MAEDNTWDVIIVGGGIVGAATFYKLQSRFPQARSEVKAVQDAADGLDAGRPLLEQSAQVEQFFAKFEAWISDK